MYYNLVQGVSVGKEKQILAIQFSKTLTEYDWILVLRI